MRVRDGSGAAVGQPQTPLHSLWSGKGAITYRACTDLRGARRRSSLISSAGLPRSGRTTARPARRGPASQTAGHAPPHPGARIDIRLPDRKVPGAWGVRRALRVCRRAPSISCTAEGHLRIEFRSRTRYLLTDQTRSAAISNALDRCDGKFLHSSRSSGPGGHGNLILWRHSEDSWLIDRWPPGVGRDSDHSLCCGKDNRGRV